MGFGISSKPRLSLVRNELIVDCSAGMQPMVSRDLMQFPVVIPGEGVMDIVVQSNVCSIPNSPAYTERSR